MAIVDGRIQKGGGDKCWMFRLGCCWWLLLACLDDAGAVAACCSILLLVTVLSHLHTHQLTHSLFFFCCTLFSSLLPVRKLSLARASVFSFSRTASDNGDIVELPQNTSNEGKVHFEVVTKGCCNSEIRNAGRAWRVGRKRRWWLSL